MGAGILFLGSAWFMWRRRVDASEPSPLAGKPGGDDFWRAAWLVFGVIFVAEWGDLTQLATAAMAARFKAPVTVFVGATLALWAVTALAVFVGNRAGKLLDPGLTKKIAAVVFAAVGVALIAGAL